MISKLHRKYCTQRKHSEADAPKISASLVSAWSSAALFTCIAMLPSHNAAAETQTTQATPIEEVDVTDQAVKNYSADRPASGKYARSLLDTPQTIGIINHDLLQEQQAVSLTQALQNTPGVSTFFAGENGTTSTGDTIYMRGFDTSSSIYIDGVRDLGSIRRDMFNIQQVEVTKGPSGPDYGRTAPSGSINLVTKRPYLGDLNEASLTFGTADQRRVTGDFNHATSDSAGLRINVMGQDSGVPGRDDVNNRQWAIAPSYAFGLGGSHRVYIDFLHMTQNNIPDGGVPTVGLPGYSSPNPTLLPELSHAAAVNPRNFYGTSADFEHVNTNMVTIRSENDLSDNVKLQNTLRWGRNQQEYLLTSFLLNAAAWSIPHPGDPTSWAFARGLPTFKNQSNSILTNQTNINIIAHTGQVKHTFAVGVELTDERLQGQGRTSSADWPKANLYAPDEKFDLLAGQLVSNGAYENARTRTAAAYLFDAMDLSKRWQLDTGIRVDRYDSQYSALLCDSVRGRVNCFTTIKATSGHVHLETQDTLASFKTGLVFKPTQSTSTYINYALSDQPPGGSTLQMSANRNSGSNPIYPTQHAASGEVGFKSSLMDARLLLTGAVYDTHVNNQVVQDIDGQYYANGKTHVKGVELGAVGSITEHWMIITGYTTTQSKALQPHPVSADAGYTLPYTPRQAFTLWTTYQLPHGLTIGGGGRYVGKMTRGSDDAPGTPQDVASYWVANGFVQYQVNTHVDLGVNAYNIFNHKYVAAINKSGYRYTPGGPRSFLVTMTVRF